jgi:hypothetical protein
MMASAAKGTDSVYMFRQVGLGVAGDISRHCRYSHLVTEWYKVCA